MPRVSKKEKDLLATNQRLKTQLMRVKAKEKARAELLAEGYKRVD
jgi:hypothetical protein